MFNHDEGGASPPQLIDHITASVSQPANDVVIGEVFDPSFHFSSPEEVRNLALYQKCGYDRENVDRNGHPAKDNEDVENSQRRVLAGIDHLVITHSCEGNDRHVEGLQKSN